MCVCVCVCDVIVVVVVVGCDGSDGLVNIRKSVKVSQSMAPRSYH